MPTLLLSPGNQTDSQRLWRTALDLGWQVERLVGWKIPDWIPRDIPIAMYGEGWFGQMVAEAFELALLQTPPDWLTTLPAPLLHRQVRAMPLVEAYALNTPHFIKPAEGKWFQAKVYANGDELRVEEKLDPHLPLLVAEPVEWEVEYRSFILEGQLLTLSPYFRHRQLIENWEADVEEIAEAQNYCTSILPQLDLPPAVVLDIGKITGRGWAVVETNPPFASGLYGCDAASALQVIARACVPLAQLNEADRRWVFEVSG